MSKPVPKHIVEVYGSAHKFRSNKRKIVAQMVKLGSELRRGCAYFPSSAKSVTEITDRLEVLRKELTTRSWGR